MTRAGERCHHCGGGIRPAERVTRPHEGLTLAFCCRGCLGAWLLITGAGLGDYYRLRDGGREGLAGGAFREEYGEASLAGHVYPSGAFSAIDILIGGLSCSSCAWLIERFLSSLAGVAEARVVYATGQARVLFDPPLVTPAAIFRRIALLGYVPRPFTPSTAEEAARRERRDLLVRFGTALFLSMQLMAFSFALYAGYFQGISPLFRQLLQLLSLLVTTPVVFYAGAPFLRGAWRGIGNRAPNMELLTAVGALSAYGYSLHALWRGGEVYFETAAMIVTLLLAGRLLEGEGRRRAAAGVERLFALAPAEARRLRGETAETVAAAALEPGDTLLVGAGERFPADATVIEGVTEADESPLTGEPLPVRKVPGTPVLSGSVNLAAPVRTRVERRWEESLIARVARLVVAAQGRRAPVQGAADRIAAHFVPAVLVLALSLFLLFLAAGRGGEEALVTSLAVVVIACPCAVGLATPLALLVGTARGAAGGVLFRGGDVLERLSRVTAVVFDKTGTLTVGRPEVVEIVPAAGVTAEALLALAAAAEAGSGHPIARGIRDCAVLRGVPLAGREGSELHPGRGVTATVGGEGVAVGSGRFLRELGVEVPPGPWDAGVGSAVVHCARDGAYVGSLLLRDRPRDDAREVVAAFRRAGAATYILSGDRQESAAEAAAHLGIGVARGELLPEEKEGFLRGLQERGEVVLMVGDGINDAPALACADVGCAVAGGTDLALESAGLLLLRADLRLLPQARRLASRTMAVVHQNLAWAAVYNLVCIPLAVSGRLTPVCAAAAMAASSLCVVGNSLRLLREEGGTLPPGTGTGVPGEG